MGTGDGEWRWWWKIKAGGKGTRLGGGERIMEGLVDGGGKRVYRLARFERGGWGPEGIYRWWILKGGGRRWGG